MSGKVNWCSLLLPAFDRNMVVPVVLSFLFSFFALPKT